MSVHLQKIVVLHAFPVVFTRHLFSPRNRALRDALTRGGGRSRCLVLLDRGVLAAHPRLPEQIRTYFTTHEGDLQLVRAPLALAGGEIIKQSDGPVRRMVEALRAGNICRHSYCIAIGGGVSNLGELLLAPMRRYAKAFAFEPCKQGFEIVRCVYTEEAVPLGAAMLAAERKENDPE